MSERYGCELKRCGWVIGAGLPPYCSGCRGLVSCFDIPEEKCIQIKYNYLVYNKESDFRKEYK